MERIRVVAANGGPVLVTKGGKTLQMQEVELFDHGNYEVRDAHKPVPAKESGEMESVGESLTRLPVSQDPNFG